MNSKFKYDYERMSGQKYRFGIKHVVNMLMRHHIRYMFWWRSYERKPTKWKRYILFRYSKKYGIEISPMAHIGEGIYLGHPYNITVG